MAFKITRAQLTFILFIIAMMLFAVWLGVALSGNCPSCLLK
jgi:hypothetical protein